MGITTKTLTSKSRPVLPGFYDSNKRRELLKLRSLVFGDRVHRHRRHQLRLGFSLGSATARLLASDASTSFTASVFGHMLNRSDFARQAIDAAS